MVVIRSAASCRSAAWPPHVVSQLYYAGMRSMRVVAPRASIQSALAAAMPSGLLAACLLPAPSVAPELCALKIIIRYLELAHRLSGRAARAGSS